MTRASFINRLEIIHICYILYKLYDSLFKELYGA
jgi:hypothetical protein